MIEEMKRNMRGRGDIGRGRWALLMRDGRMFFGHPLTWG
jgi:hypothetical protein